MINFFKKFSEINRNIKDSQRLINLVGVVKVYYGINKDGFFRLAFLSANSPNIKGSTKNIEIIQGNSGDNNYWTCFDLKNDQLLPVFSIFCEDLASCVVGEMDEHFALLKLKNRFSTRTALFKKSRKPLSLEKAKGLYGELYFLDNYLLKKYGEDKTIRGWGGPEMYSKDFSIDNTWYEIKTINASSTIAKIASIQQLSSDLIGRLVIVRVEEMTDSYDGELSSINKLCQNIISKIESNEIKDIFLDKLSSLGFDFCDDLANKNYNVSSIETYIVEGEFPALKENDIKSEAINNVSYELILKLIKDYRKDLK